MNIDKQTLESYYYKIKFLFKNINSIREHLDIIFVFGRTEENNNRDLFLEYANRTNLTPFKFVTIEFLYKDIIKFSSAHKGASSKKIKLANLELMAIKHSYSVLIFPESPGSFAELGFFSADESTREKILLT